MIKVGDTVSRPGLGLGEVVEVIFGLVSPIYVRVDWDRDPSENYNMGNNPSLEYISTLTIEESL